MGFGPESIFTSIKERMHVLAQRERLIAENIANANTPGFVPRDVNLKGFEKALADVRRAGSASGATNLARTQAGHIGGGARGQTGLLKIENAPDSETTIDGNQVVLEEQTLKLADTRSQYEQAASLYRKGLDLLRLAARTPR